MSEAETLELIAIFSANSWNYFAIYLSITFAYLAVAYFVGANLNRFQVNAISGLFIVSASGATIAAFTTTSTWIALIKSRPTLMDDIAIYSAGIWDYYIAAPMVVGIFVSLYFMYEIRARKTKDDTST